MLTGIHNAVLIYNPTAGRNVAKRVHHLEDARRILGKAGIATDLHATSAAGDATQLASQAVREGREMIIVCGGDGTMNEVVNGMAAEPAGPHVPLALLPGGTANILAKELQLPWNIPRAAELLLRGTLKKIALGVAVPLENQCAQRYFICVAGAGPDGEIVHAVNPEIKRRAGIVAYWLEGFRQLGKYTFPRLRVHSTERGVDATLLIVGRTKHYGGPFRITIEADLFEDWFELAALTTQSTARYLSYLPMLWLNKLRYSKDVHFWKTTTVRCDALNGKTIYAQVDGESLCRLPVEFRIVPQALTLVVPPPPAK
jgi:YegS/Rv2252/BmrU family lipid kinase